MKPLASTSASLAALLAACTLASPAIAQEMPLAEPAEAPAPSAAPDPGPTGLTGDWDGLRSRLADRGVTPFASALAELASNVDGGLRRRTSVATQLNGGVDLDMDRLTGWRGAKVRIEFAYRDGENLSATGVGNLFEVQETYGGGRIARLAEFSLEQSLADGRVSLKAGRIFAGSDFATSPVFCAFVSNAFCGHPNSIPYNINLSLYPVASWGARIEVQPTKRTYVRTGVFEQNPSLNFKHGFDWSTRGATGVLLPVEVGYRTDFGSRREGLVRIGGYYDTSDTPDSYRDTAGGSIALTGLPAAIRAGRWGLYAMAEQKVIANALAGDRGLTLFAGATLSDRQTAYFRYFLEAGLVQTGTFPGRDRDTFGLAVAYGRVSPDRARFQRDADLSPQSAETVFELAYGFSVSPWLTMRPNLQYIVRPGATGDLLDATVIGLQTVLAF